MTRIVDSRLVRTLRAASSALRLGTRRSQLAIAQSTWAASQVGRSGRQVDLVEIATAGDLSTAPVEEIGGAGVFVTALRTALLAHEVDFVVHSCKDLPAAEHPGLALAAVPTRVDPWDALVWPGGASLRNLPVGARVGTSSARRSIELTRLGLPVEVVPMRGNVNSRLRKVTAGEIDALLLAVAGLTRLGRMDVVTEVIDPALILPAPAQGALAVECRADDDEMIELLSALDDPASRVAVTAERAFLAALDAGCTAPVGALAAFVPGPRPELRLEGLVSSHTGRRGVRSFISGPTAEAAALGRELVTDMLAAGSVRP